MNLVLAGITFPCGVDDLAVVGREHGYSALFLDHPHNRVHLEAAAADCVWSDDVPTPVAGHSGIFLPLLESWVSAGMRMPRVRRLRFDQHAAEISRSKAALSAAMQDAGLPHVPRVTVRSPAEALRIGREWSGRMILRTDSGYSGRNVWHVSDPDDLGRSWDRYCSVANTTAALQMRAVLETLSPDTVLEPWIDGAEWSIDCVVGPDFVYIIRVCEKIVTLIDQMPATIGYRITTDPQLRAQLQLAAEQWCSALFRDPHRLAFACFDVRQNDEGALVPLDFGVRLGGDHVPTLVRHASRAHNPYAAALNAAIRKDARLLAPLTHGTTIIHTYARKQGTLLDHNCGPAHLVLEARTPGSRIVAEPGNVKSLRVATTMTRYDTFEQFDDACHLAHTWCRVTPA